MDEQEKALEEKDGLKEEKNKRDDHKRGATDWFNDVKGEFKKIVWPKKKELVKQTVTVIITSLLVGVIIIGMDSVYGILLQFVSSFLNQ